MKKNNFISCHLVHNHLTQCEDHNKTFFVIMATFASLEDVKTIDQKEKDFIFGYIRKVQRIFPDDNVYYTIPTLVIHWILLYYFVREQFDEDNKSRHYSISEDKMTTTREKLGGGAVYLTNIAKNGVHEWTFKLRKCNTLNYYFVIGVWKNQHPVKTNYNLYGREVMKYSYGWVINYNRKTGDEEGTYWIRYGLDKCKTDDIVVMILDLNEKTLSYKVNEVSYGVAFENIEDTEYKAVISTNWTEDSIELISYSMR